MDLRFFFIQTLVPSHGDSYLLKRCSSIYAYASGIILKSDAVSSKNFIEISNNLLFKSVELMVIEENKKLEEAHEEAETKWTSRLDLFLDDKSVGHSGGLLADAGGHLLPNVRARLGRWNSESC